MYDIPHDSLNQPSSEYVQVINKETNFLMTKGVKIKGIIKIPPKDSIPKTYEELIRSPKDEELIEELISSMAEKTKINLVLSGLHMEELGDHVRHVHPFRFFGYVYSHPQLKESMKLILDDYWKKNLFVNGMTPSLNNEHRIGSLKTYLIDFCREIDAEPYQIQPYITSRDWTGMLNFLSRD